MKSFYGGNKGGTSTSLIIELSLIIKRTSLGFKAAPSKVFLNLKAKNDKYIF